MLGLHCSTGFSLVAGSVGYFLLMLPGFSSPWLLLLQSSRVPGLPRMARGLSSFNSQALESRLNSCVSWAYLLHCMWDLPRLGSNPRLLHWQADSLPLSHQGSLVIPFLRALPSRAHYVTKTLPQNTITLGFNLQHVNFGKTQTFSAYKVAIF